MKIDSSDELEWDEKRELNRLYIRVDGGTSFRLILLWPVTNYCLQKYVEHSLRAARLT